MKDRIITARKDTAGSEGVKYARYTFGDKDSAINGGVYIDKAIKVPDRIVIVLVKEAVDE